MKSLFTSLFFMSLAYSASSQLFIAGVIDGNNTGGLPKGIQICADANITDLSIYGFGSANNGGGTDGEEFTFPAEATNSGDCFWISSNAASFNTFFGFDPCYVDAAANINGDDAVELFCNSVVIDVFGDPDTNGDGEPWDYTDGWAKRTTAAPDGTFNLAQWSFSGINALDPYGTNAEATAGGDGYPAPGQTCPLVSLPIALSAFSVDAIPSEGIQLSWTTDSEINNEFFAIQHSTNGRDFETIEEVAGAGNSLETIDYSFVHQAPARGINYYRLKQVDYSRAFSLSEVASMNWGKAVTLQVWPTLVNQSTTVQLGEEKVSGKLSLTNLQGQVVFSKELRNESGSITLELTDLISGSYIIILESDGLLSSNRILIQR